MCAERFKRRTEALFNLADIQIGGSRPWDIQVRDARLFRRIWAHGSLGFGEAYMDGWWSCQALDAFFARILAADLPARVRTWRNLGAVILARCSNLQKPSRAYQIGRRHYDLSNKLYRAMLDRRMIYSCAYWADAQTLDEAQEAKLEIIAKKLGLTSGMRILDLGCGWGGAARFFAERYGVEVVGITVSKEQARVGRAVCANLPVDIRLQDYRSLDGRFDRIYSIGMYEHVGYKNYRTFAEVVRRCLRRDGLMLLHTIGSPVSLTHTDPWIARYIFPNSMLPSARQISASMEGLFIMEDWHNLGAHYDRTLVAWWKNFEAAWDRLAPAFDERFHRMWRYYLLACAGAFRARVNQLWQIVFSPEGVRGGYDRDRRTAGIPVHAEKRSARPSQAAAGA